MDGIICVYKPCGYTSFDVIAIMRRLLSTRKVGHSGTLDPIAEGVLPVFAGTATKAVDFCPESDKEYRAAFRLGTTTDTLDSTGTVLTQQECRVSRLIIANVLNSGKFVGDVEQIPPMYSAVKVNGRRLYDIARQGEPGDEIERKPRRVTVHELELEEYDDVCAGVLRVRCSKGTYVRTLISDIGAELGCGAVMTGLQRTLSNGFTLADCHTLDSLRDVYCANPDNLSGLLLPLDRLFACYPRGYLDEEQTRIFRNGAALNADLVRFDRIYDGVYAMYDCKERFTALAKIDRDHTLEVVKRFLPL